MSNKSAYSKKIKEKALELGFAACGIAKTRKLEEEVEGLRKYLSLNYHGKMAYLANHSEKRIDPTLLVPGAKSIVVVLLNYFPHQLQTGKDVPIIAKYAYGRDYHRIIKQKLQILFDYIQHEIQPIAGRVFTDSAPVLERTWAVQAGLGWIGKNGLLIHRELGSFFFIGELIIDMELEYDEPFDKEYCGHCNQCLSACPTNAFNQPYVLDARRCISYLTIELKEEISETFRPKLLNRVFGCDICQDVCPWNRKPAPHKVDEFIPHPNFYAMTKEHWKNLSKETFSLLFNDSAIQRAGYKKLMETIKFATSSDRE